ncbi:MAG: hypothetical protein SPF41_04280 [Candidatus Merdousia sp.]|nr:hypothetical protein [Candidatus Merdousia sp.]
MKRTSLILLSTLCAFAANAAVDIPGGTSSTDRPVVKDIADGQDVRLLPNAEAPTATSNISMAGATVKSIEIAEKSVGGYTLAFGATIDNNGSENDFALRNNSSFSWYLTYQTLNLINSGSDTAVSKYEMGTGTFFGFEGATVKVNTNAAFTGNALKFDGNNYGVAFIIGTANTKLVNVDYNIAKTEFLKNSALGIKTGSTFTSGETAEFSFAATTNLNIAGTFNYGNLTKNLEFNGTGTIWAKGVIVLNQGLNLKSGSVLKIVQGRTDFSSGAAIRRGTAGNGRLILSGGTLDIDSVDAVAVGIGLYAGTDSTISISADNSFQNVFFNLNTHLSLILENSAKASFRSIGLYNEKGTANVDLSIEGFAADSVFFDSNTWWDSAQITATDADNNVYQKDQLELVAVGEDLAKYGNYVLSVKQIPEPATYAAVFGAMALALAVYRRRK